MRTFGNILVLAVFVGGSAAGAYLLAERNPPLSKRATDAYQAGRYEEAVPLLKKWAEGMSIKKDGPQMGKVLTELADAEAHVRGLSGGSTQPAVAETNPMPISVPSGAGRSPTAALDPSTGKTRIPHSRPQGGQPLAMTIKELGNFDFDPTADADIPADVKAMDGAKIRLHGFMIPLTQADTITNFALVPSLVGCCFGQPPGVQHTITCKTAEGQAVAYTVDEISVEGTLKINVQRDQGYTFSIFDMQVNSVKPLE